MENKVKKCSACGKRAEGLGTYPTELKDAVLCSTCYEGLSFRKGQKFKSIEGVERIKTVVNKEMQEKQFAEKAVEQINAWFEDKKGDVKAQLAMEVFEKQQKACMMTSGFNFEGYRIIAYHGVIFGESVLGTGFLSSLDASVSDMLGAESSSFIQKLQEARELAQKRAILQAMKAGGNAIIGVDIDYTMFNNNMIGVIVNATSVTIEKIR